MAIDEEKSEKLTHLFMLLLLARESGNPDIRAEVEPQLIAQKPLIEEAVQIAVGRDFGKAICILTEAPKYVENYMTPTMFSALIVDRPVDVPEGITEVQGLLLIDALMADPTLPGDGLLNQIKNAVTKNEGPKKTRLGAVMVLEKLMLQQSCFATPEFYGLLKDVAKEEGKTKVGGAVSDLITKLDEAYPDLKKLKRSPMKKVKKEINKDLT